MKDMPGKRYGKKALAGTNGPEPLSRSCPGAGFGRRMNLDAGKEAGD
ncbi:hypothetical protein MCJ35_10250 [Enterocloster sp. OA13]|uniref:Uncharacterized protein n=1 Tax=Enterocloster hominis (ex Hitch et al. 2024) TaxID=1917870 RepID=A0ABV1DA44_9FIRM|nr:hypothetical protein [Lachnoclostridium pacaense]MCC2875425.1 hypothetical protein [Lachnoclostridium pacaense]MCD8171808.1 hypothetical protein [Clostridiales bacterium]MCH1949583.1 hypothetical protein [Enterocloster sp. OA13]